MHPKPAIFPSHLGLYFAAPTVSTFQLLTQ